MTWSPYSAFEAIEWTPEAPYTNWMGVMYGVIHVKSSKTIDKMFHWFIWRALKVKSTISNVFVIGESEKNPVSNLISMFCYLERLQHLKPEVLVKQVYLNLLLMHNCGHSTLITSVFEQAQGYNLAIGIDHYDSFKKNCRLICYQKPEMMKNNPL